MSKFGRRSKKQAALETREVTLPHGVWEWIETWAEGQHRTVDEQLYWFLESWFHHYIYDEAPAEIAAGCLNNFQTLFGSNPVDSDCDDEVFDHLIAMN